MLDKNPVILFNSGLKCLKLGSFNGKLHFCTVDEDTLKAPNSRHPFDSNKSGLSYILGSEQNYNCPPIGEK